MAKQLFVTVVATIIFFLLTLTLSQARIPSNLPPNDVINREVHNTLPVSDVTPTIRLPSEASNGESHPSEASNEESHVDSTNGEPNTVTVTTVPLKFVSFRPINRRFYTLRGRFPFHRCHGRRHHQNFKPLGQRSEIPYGDDMILSAAIKRDWDSGPMNFHGGEGQIPSNSKWVRLHHLHHHHHHHHLHHDQDELEGNSMKHEKTREKGGLLRRFRKFLNQLEF